ncbi:MAG: uncharacterized protein JWM12_3877 [Ilumatobacteraceae bacterium]|jgi:hypothetical protein|nr:uncharacterized protein [Ilumatobacteraceae bacterium]
MSTAPRRLTLADIADSRAYERERDEFRSRVTALKQRRRLPIGPVVTVVFENRDTIRFQIQEMARVERLTTDAAIQEELDTYNPLVPEPGALRATLFIELTNDEEVREWLPKLVGIERAVVLHLDGGGVVRCAPDARHASQLTREHITAAVHYIGFELTAEEIDAFGRGATIAVDHPEYPWETAIPTESIAELLGDLRG